MARPLLKNISVYLPFIVLMLMYSKPTYSEKYNYKKYDPKEFKEMLIGKNKSDVKNLIGKPDSTSSFFDDVTGMWSYDGISLSERTRKELFVRINSRNEADARESLPDNEKWTIYDEHSGKSASSLTIFFKQEKVESVKFSFY